MKQTHGGNYNDVKYNYIQLSLTYAVAMWKHSWVIN